MVYIVLPVCYRISKLLRREKLTEILKRNDVRSLTVAQMEVPCCSALNVVAQHALDASGKMIPTQRLIVSVDGDINRA
jgi:hypothetical protein